MEFEKVKQKVVIRTADRILFVNELLAFGSHGARVQRETLPRLVIPFTAELEVMVDPKNPFRDTPSVRAYPPSNRVYTEEELESLVFEEFRTTMAIFGIKGRERGKMVEEYKEYLKKISEY